MKNGRKSRVIKLIATDMDGTLLNSKGELSPHFEHVFNALKEKGIIFAAASGRQYFTLLENFKAYKDDMLFIAENGTYVAYKGEELAVHPLDQGIAHELILKGRTLGPDVNIVLATSKGAFVESKDERFVNEVKKYYIKCEVVDDLMQIEGDILKVTLGDFKGAEQHSYKAFKCFEDRAQVCLAGEIWIDIMANGISKGTAIKDIQEKLHIDFNETMVFGDYLNDLEMIKSAYHSYAMANAHPLLKETARFEAKSNDEDGVIEKIKEII